MGRALLRPSTRRAYPVGMPLAPNYFTADRLEELARYDIPTSLQLENRGLRETTVWRVHP